MQPTCANGSLLLVHSLDGLCIWGRLWVNCQKCQYCFLLIHSWLSFQLCSLFFSTLLLLLLLLRLLSATCALSCNERVMPLKKQWIRPWLFPGNMKSLNMVGHWASGSVSPCINKCFYLMLSQSGICQMDHGLTLSLYDCLFYPSAECMSTECPVTSLL